MPEITPLLEMRYSVSLPYVLAEMNLRSDDLHKANQSVYNSSVAPLTVRRQLWSEGIDRERELVHSGDQIGSIRERIMLEGEPTVVKRHRRG